MEIRQGDVVLFHTGWVSLIGKDDKRYSAGEPGLGVEGAKYLVGKGVVAVGADSWGLEVVPFETQNVFEVHQILLPMNGTYILENMNTAQLAADRAYEFMFVLGQPRFKGARAEHDQPGRDPVGASPPGADDGPHRHPMRPVSRQPQEHVKMLRTEPLDFDVASNGHNAALETEEPVMTTRRIFLGSTLVAASAAALPRLPSVKVRPAPRRSRPVMALKSSSRIPAAPAVRS